MAISYTVSYTFSPSTTISSSQVNTNFSDNANVWNGLEAKTKTFSNLGVDVELKTGGSLLSANGTVAAPSISFTNSTGSGLYRIGTDDIGIATNGTLVIEIANTGVITAYKTLVFSPTTVGIKGTTTNDSTAALNVGEVISSSIVRSSPVSLSTGTAVSITNVSLTAGDWDVRAAVGLLPGGATSITEFISSISVTNNTRSGIDTSCAPNSAGEIYITQNSAGVVPGNGNAYSTGIPPVRVSIASTTTYYLVVSTTFTVSTLSAYGSIVARRTR